MFKWLARFAVAKKVYDWWKNRQREKGVNEEKYRRGDYWE